MGGVIARLLRNIRAGRMQKAARGRHGAQRAAARLRDLPRALQGLVRRQVDVDADRADAAAVGRGRRRRRLEASSHARSLPAVSALYALDGLIGVVTHVRGRPQQAGRLRRAGLQPRDGPAAARARLALHGRRAGRARRGRQARALMKLDFRDAGHLPNLRRDGVHDDPDVLPRQRAGITPQMHGRYPDFDVLSQADHWDEVTRRVVLDRVENVPPFRFFGEREQTRPEGVLRRRRRPGRGSRASPFSPTSTRSSTRASATAGSTSTCPTTARRGGSSPRGLDEAARSDGVPLRSPSAPLDVQRDIVSALRGRRSCAAACWEQLNVSARLERRHALDAAQAFYSHPWAWNEIGFGGPPIRAATPRSAARSSASEAEPWEGREASIATRSGTRQRGLE